MNPLCVGDRHSGVAWNQTRGSSLPWLIPLPSQPLYHSASSRNQHQSQNDVIISKKGKLGATQPLDYVLTELNVFCGEGNGTPLQYSCLENPMDWGAWWAAVHGVAKGLTWLRDFTFTFHFDELEKEMATHSSVLAWRIPGWGSLVSCRLWGCTESDTTEET